MGVTVGALYASTSVSCYGHVLIYKSAELLFKVGVIVRIHNNNEQCHQKNREDPILFREETRSGDPLVLLL